MENNNLRDYLVKWNDRNIQKSGENGFTLFALIGVFVICINYLINNIDTLNLVLSTDKIFDYFTIVINLFFAVGYIIVRLNSRVSYKKNSRIYLNTKFFAFTIFEAPLLIPITITFAANFYQTFYLDDLPLYLNIWFLILSGLNLLTLFIIPAIKLYIRRKRRKKGLRNHNFSFDLFDENEFNKVLNFTLSLLGSFFITYCIFSLLSFDFERFESYKLSYVEIFRLVFFIMGGAYILIIIFDKIEKKQEDEFLEELEKEAVLSNLSNEELKRELEEHIFGINFNDWLKEKQTSFNLVNEELQKSFIEEKTKLVELQEVNKEKYQFEYEGRQRSLIKSVQELYNNADTYYRNLKDEINYLKTFSNLDKEEFNKVVNFTELIGESYSNFQTEYEDILKNILK